VQSNNLTSVSGGVNIGAERDVHIGGDVVGRDKITVGYTVDQVSALLTQISTTFQPRAFDGRCPYKGLDVFEEEDADLFFGREKLISDLIERVARSRTVFITGPSGSGKSSLVRAGLLHALKQGALPGSERWLYEALKPGRNPLDELARIVSSLTGTLSAGDDVRAQSQGDATRLARWAEVALKDQRDRRVVLFVDQFEEVFTQVAKEPERLAFLNLLTHAATVESGRTIVLLAMRSDFVSNCAIYPELNALLNRQFLQVGAMQPAELVSAIAQPALRVGLRIDPDLIAQIINDMEGEPGALPLMQFALKDLFDAQQARGGVKALTLPEYVARGGIHKALERHADASFSVLAEPEQAITRQVFSGLIQVGRGTQDTRRTAAFSELVPAGVDQSSVEGVIRKLADARLVTTDQSDGQDVVTIAHERLIDAWPWLKRLVNDNREAIALQNDIAEDAQEWDKSRRDPSYLYVGARLANAQEQLTAQKIVLSGLAQAFVAAGAAAAELELQREEARRQKELDAALQLAESEKQRAEEQARSAARLRRRAVYLIGALGIALLLGLAAAGFGVQSNQAANANATLAAQNASIASTAQSASAQAIFEANTRATAEASAIAQRDEAQRQSRISLARELAAKSIGQAARDGDVGLLLASEAVKIADSLGPNVVPEAQTALYEALSTANFDRVLRWHASRLTVAQFNPDGSSILTVDADGSARLWGVDGTEVATLTGLSGDTRAASFSPDGLLFVTGGGDNIVRLWRGDGSLLATLGEFASSVNWVEFSPSGKLIIAASYDGSARVWRPDGAVVTDLIGHTASINSARFSPDETLIVTASNDQTARIWRINGTLAAELKGHSAEVRTAAFSPDGQRVLTGSWDKTARLWNVDGTLITTLAGHAASVNIAEFGPDGSEILTVGTDATARLWRADGSQLATLAGHTSFINAASISPDGSLIVTASSDDSARVWRSDGTFVVALRGHSKDVSHAAFSPDGQWIVTGSEDDTVRLWRVDQLFSHMLEGHTDWVNVVAYSPDGSQILTASDDGTARLWDKQGRLPHVLEGHTFAIRWAAFNQDGSRLVTASGDGTARLWSSDGKLINTFEGSTEYTWTVCLSPDGTHLVTRNDNGPAWLWRDDGTRLAELDTPAGSNLLDCFSLDGKLLAAQDATGLNANVWQADGKLVATLTGHTAIINSVRFSPDGTQLVTASDDGTARVWRTDGTPIRSLSVNTATINSAIFTADGQEIVTFHDDYLTRIWDADGSLAATLAGASAPFALSLDQSTILTIDPDSVIRLWRLDGTLLSVLTSTVSSDLSALAFSRDGRTLLLGGGDGTAQLWDTAHGRLLGTLDGHTDRVWSASFNADGSRVVTASRDGTTRLWAVFGDVEAMLAEAQRRVDRPLYDDECRVWVGQPCETLP
jgi:WD40 repeat protein